MQLRKNSKAETTPKDAQPVFDSFDDESEEKGSSNSGHVPVAPQYGEHTGRWIGVLALVIAVGLGTAFFAVNKIKAREEFGLQQDTQKKIATLPLVDVAVAKPAPGYKSLILPAATKAWYRTTIYSRVSGYLQDWNVDIGDRVRKGQILATIETPDLDAQLDAARAELRLQRLKPKSERPMPISREPLTIVGVIRLKALSPIRSARRKRPALRAALPSSMQPKQRLPWMRRR